jgi:hypothetical protein
MSDYRPTKSRVYGEDSPYLRWVRGNKNLPSRSGIAWIGVQDVDCLIHEFMTRVDRVGTRELQAFMFQEAKTRNGEPDSSQRDTWWKIHRMMTGVGTLLLDCQTLWFYGVSVVSFSGTYPDDSDKIRWGRYDDIGNIRFRSITTEQLTLLNRFDLDPDTLKKIDYRRHHKTQVFAIQTVAELGFPIIEKKTRKS